MFDLLSPGSQPEKLLDYDLIGFGSGIYWWRHHWALLKLVDDLPRMEGKKAFIFSTAGMNIPWHNHIVREFSCRGRTQTGWLTKIGGINKGRPNDKDLERTKKFAEKLRNMGSTNPQKSKKLWNNDL